MLFISRKSLNEIIRALRAAELCDSRGVIVDPSVGRTEVEPDGYEIAAMMAVTSVVTTWTKQIDIVLPEDVSTVHPSDDGRGLEIARAGLRLSVNPFKGVPSTPQT